MPVQVAFQVLENSMGGFREEILKQKPCAGSTEITPSSISLIMVNNK
jgi:hypothetical protein